VTGHYRRRATIEFDIDEEAGCWSWKGNIDTSGYGRIRFRGQGIFAHRLFWVASRGPIPPGLVIDHLCRNKACVNPTHLECVSRGENSRRGEGTKLTKRQASTIRSTLVSLAERYGVSIRTLCGVAEGHTWKDA
jgi:hypothetical protein